MKKPDDVWLQEKIQTLKNLARDLKKDGPLTEYRLFTALKLISIHFYSSVFAPIAHHHGDGAVYVDLFAGTGLVRTKNSRREYLSGSPICATSLDRGAFDYIVCVESEKNRCDVLAERLRSKIQQDKFDVVHGNCNEKIGEVIENILTRYKNPIVLVFADPEALQLKFKTLQRLAAEFKKCDFVIHVNAQAVKRVEGKVKRGINNVASSLTEFYNCDISEVLAMLSNDTPEKTYAKRVQDVLGKPIGDMIKIRSSRGKVEYYVLFYTRLTSGGSAYMNSVLALKRRLDSITLRAITSAFDMLEGNQQPLDKFGGSGKLS